MSIEFDTTVLVNAAAPEVCNDGKRGVGTPTMPMKPLLVEVTVLV
jgi:hypothetical protein